MDQFFDENEMERMAKEYAIPAPKLKLFFVLDTSGSMEGNPITSLNRLMKQIVTNLRALDAKNDTFDIQIAVMRYSTEASWITENGPEDIHKYQHPDMTAGGVTRLDKALALLNKALSPGEGKDCEWMKRDSTANFMPIFVFISDGLPMGQWERELEKLKKNVWFRNNPKSKAVKLGFLLTLDGVDMSEAQAEMEKLVGDAKNVLTFNDLDVFIHQVDAKVVGSTILQAKQLPAEEKPSADPAPADEAYAPVDEANEPTDEADEPDIPAESDKPSDSPPADNSYLGNLDDIFGAGSFTIDNVMDNPDDL